LRELDQPESDADIAASLDAVDAEPLSDEATQRILQCVRHSIATAVAAGGSTRESGASHRISLRRVEIVPPPPRGLSQIGIVAACAVALLAIGLVFFRSNPGDRAPVAAGNRLTPELRPGELISANDRTPLAPSPSGGSHPDSGTGRAESSSNHAVIQRVKPGETLTTGPREKRRVTLPDGSVLSINEQSRVTIVGERRVKLLVGEVFVEVVPFESSERFVVETPHRTVTALGTKFVVKAHDRATNVVVTQGKVRVSGVEEAVSAGQELIADLTESNSAELRPAKRSAYVVEWVKDLMAAAGSIVVPTSEHAGGTVTVVDPQGQEMKLSLRKFHVDVHIEEGFARTTIDQTYFNHTWQQLEGTFRFPLPADASLSRLAMYVNGKLMEGGMVERDYGRNVFEQIRHTRRDPALLEWVDGSTFQMRVFPLEPRQEKRILLSYTQRLPNDYGKSVYRFPAGHSLEGVRDWSAQLRVKGEAGAKWYSPSHLLSSRDEQGDLVIDGREEYAALDRDLVVEFGQEIKEKPPVELEEVIRRPMEKVRGRPPFGSQQSMWSVCEQDGFQYVMLRYRPELAAARQRSPQQWIFLVENSADRNDLLAETQRQIVKVLLENAEHTDTFSIIRAGTQADAFRRKPVACSLENVAAAQEFMREVAPIGALDLEQALQAVQKQVRGQREAWIVHLGTGIPVLGERDETTLLRLVPAKARYVGVAVGKRWSKSFMETAANHSGGHVTQINPDEAVAWRAFDLLSTLNAPRLTEITVHATLTRSASEGERSTDTATESRWLRLTNSLAHGQELATVARFPKGQPLPKSVVITGKLDGQKNQSILEVPNPSHCGHLPRTWARLEIDRLVALGATEHKPQIIELSKSMYVMSPFTSLLVLETEAMYEQFKVDRGRKDHWAMYPAPAEIPVVADQGPMQFSPLDAAKERLKLSQARAKSAQSNYELSVTEQRPATDLQRLDRLNRAEQAEVRLIESEIQRIERANAAAADPTRIAWESVVQRRSAWQQSYLQTTRNHWNYWGRPTTWNDSGMQFLGELPSDLRTVEDLNSFLNVNVSGNLSGSSFEAMDGRWDVNGKLFYPMLSFGNGSDQSATSHGLPRVYSSSIMGLSPIPVTPYFSTLTEDGYFDDKRYFRVPMMDSVRDQILGARVARPVIVLSDSLDFEIEERFQQGINTGDSFLRPDVLLAPIGVEYEYDVAGFQQQNWWRNQYTNGYEFIQNVFSRPVDWIALSKRRSKFLDLSWGNHQIDFVDGDFDGDGILDEFNTLPGLVTTRVMAKSGGDGTRSFVTNGAFMPFVADGSTAFDSWHGAFDRSHRYVKVGLNHPLTGVLKDLPSYAPGLQTWPADRLAIVEQVAAMKPQRGEVDAESRRLIEKARSLGWESCKMAAPGRPAARKSQISNLKSQTRTAEGGHPTVIADGSGRFVFEREIGEGLKETVINDGSTLWHLYPEIGLGAKRTLSRFHQSAIQSLIPWYVPSVDDLSVDADVKSVGERTIRITRRMDTPARPNSGDGQESPSHEIAIELV
ncbi:MAG: FecR domain-containing protein, partial [Planctomycetaceae bacterium]|nr:FecR domain-containing protein [Planctomycetaceae bacterium]